MSASHFILRSSNVPRSTDEFERVIMPHARNLLGFARRLTGSAAAAEDLAQDALMQAWRGFHQFRGGSNSRAWLFRILLNAFYAQARKGALRTVPLLADAYSGAGGSVDDRLSVQQALDTLGEEQRAVILLGVVEGFTCKEMAEILGVPAGTVMSRLSRARGALREMLAPSAVHAGSYDR